MKTPWDIQVFDELESTQDALRGVGEPYRAVQALHQTGGRGRHGRVWESLPGNLSFSFTYKVPDEVGLFSLSVGVAVARALQSFGFEPRLKWPNDVLLDGKKCAGILIEREGDVLIVGIGVNVAEPVFEGAAHLGAGVDVVALRDKILRGVGRGSSLDEWLGLAHPLEQALSVKLGAEVYQGTFAGLDARGSLLLDIDGEVKVITAGDVYVTP